MAGTLQEGIFHGPGASPPGHCTQLFLRADRGTGAERVGELLAELWGVYRDLTRGTVRDLPGHPVDPGGLQVLIGYGPKVFDLAGAGRTLPATFAPEFRFRSASPSGGGPLLSGRGLQYAPDVRQNPATEEVCVQFTADTALGVHRPVVETWKLLHDRADPALGVALLAISAVFTGFQRADGRSWIDFHDGISNLRSDQRARVIQIDGETAAGDDWIIGGTYLAFLRLAVDLDLWRDLTRDQQELLVGRDKLTGSPLVGRTPEGGPRPDPRCPVAATTEVVDAGNEEFREPGTVDDPVVQASHVHRANQNKFEDAARPNSLRIFRQGYEFLEPSPVAPGFRAGLNFVSFQDTPDRLIRVLRQQKWLGDVNFGGEAGQQPAGMDRLLTVRGAGIYLVPPLVPDEPFPGAAVFG
ncbi:Dyp-type peroxidase [Geodermatophilus marinus]|uniref:Dyp-type peroxidase n=1 Tax=Geodermatophilus sp. LHW52908 TaxID=2303986 RepID=UPI000E3ED15C|nr:Dyp-type peroxidase domain-containing protein [Geodermatophilus sp. LHW52908]RFU19907.1 peroxidase [Geodermatophilus sp. LHW52908]